MAALYVLLAQKIMTPTERFAVMPAMIVLGLVVAGFGLRAIVTKKVNSGIKQTMLHGHREYTGTSAVLRGVILVVGGLGLALSAVYMMVIGKTLLPGR